MISPFTEEKKCCKNVIFLLILDKLFVTELLHAKLTKSCEKLIKSMYFLFILYIFCNIFVNAVCYFVYHSGFLLLQMKYF